MLIGITTFTQGSLSAIDPVPLYRLVFDPIGVGVGFAASSAVWWSFRLGCYGWCYGGGW